LSHIREVLLQLKSVEVKPLLNQVFVENVLAEIGKHFFVAAAVGVEAELEHLD